MKLDCNKTAVFISERIRMCRTYPSCNGCPFYEDDNECRTCGAYISNNILRSIGILQDWSDAHPIPQKTYADDYFEKFPNAPKTKNGFPEVPWCKVYGNGSCSDVFTALQACESCWARIIKT